MYDDEYGKYVSSHAQDRRDIKWFIYGVITGLCMFFLFNYIIKGCSPWDPRCCERQSDRNPWDPRIETRKEEK